MMRWPVDEIGRNSVTPSTTPRRVASVALSSPAGPDRAGAGESGLVCPHRVGTRRQIATRAGSSLRTPPLVSALPQRRNFFPQRPRATTDGFRQRPNLVSTPPPNRRRL